MKNNNYKQTEIGEIPQDWSVGRLGNFCEVKGGKRLPKGESFTETKTNHPYIRIKDITEDGINKSNLLYLTESTHQKIKRYIINEGDVYISIVGTIGLSGIIDKELNGANLTENAARLFNFYGLNSKYLSYFLKSPTGQRQIKSRTVGSTQSKLALFRINDIIFPLAKLEEQQQIASILSSLDDKIELNRKMNKTLEEIGRALFKRWFVDFEFPCLLTYGERTQAFYPELNRYGYKPYGGLPAPEPGKYFVYVLELENGHHYIGITDFILKRYNEHLTGEGAKYTLQYKPVKVLHWEEYLSRQEAAAREQWLKTGFGRKWIARELNAGRLRQAGGEMVESELGEIPKGWEVGKLSDLVGNIKVSYKGNNLNDKLPYVPIDEITSKNLCLTETADFREAKSSLIEFQRFDILFGAMRPYFHKVALAPFEGLTRTTCFILRSKKEEYYSFCVFKIFDKETINFATDHSEGSTIPYAKWNNGLSEMPIMVSNKEIANKFNLIIKPFLLKICDSYFDIKTLIEIRDSLLSRLMSGKLRVN